MLNTRLLMSANAAVLGLLGLVSTFAPEYVLSSITAGPSASLLLMVQVLGALYLCFAALNWMARVNLIGGIYSRPVAIGNLMHVLVGGLAMFKAALGGPALPMLWLLARLYAGFAIAFGYILFRHPLTNRPAETHPHPQSTFEP